MGPEALYTDVLPLSRAFHMAARSDGDKPDFLSQAVLRFFTKVSDHLTPTPHRFICCEKQVGRRAPVTSPRLTPLNEK